MKKTKKLKLRLRKLQKPRNINKKDQGPGFSETSPQKYLKDFIAIGLKALENTLVWDSI